MNSPPFSLKTKSLRDVLMFGDCGDDGLFWVEPMRFLFPSEAKREVQAEHSTKLLAHNNGRDWLKREALS